MVVPASGGKGAPLLNGNASESNGQISPDGEWVAYASNETGEWEIYVTTFPGAAGKFQVSRGGGSEPRWRGDGKEMFYLSPSGMLMAVTVISAKPSLPERHAALPGSRPRSYLLHRPLHLRRHPRRPALHREPIPSSRPPSNH